ncbi:MAG: hypothetical protein B6244_06690 [Candidatus Cloacimonetes bacterium 4572_55]|nr:MAG: hypothetical protein B6244_06690 [Candidatus Cloacimonetes bacterium 4572_55]
MINGKQKKWINVFFISIASYAVVVTSYLFRSYRHSGEFIISSWAVVFFLLLTIPIFTLYRRIHRHHTNELNKINRELKAEISEHKLSKEALQKSEENYRHLFERSLNGIYRTTLGGRILIANTALCRMMGYKSLERLSELNISQGGYKNPEDRKRFIRIMKNHGEVIGFESEWLTKDGKSIFVRENARSVFDEKGKFLYFEGKIEDITKRKAAEMALRETQERYRYFVENAGDFIYETNVRGYFVYINPTAAHTFGYSQNEFVGKFYLDLIRKDYRPRVKRMYKKQFIERVPKSYLEIPLIAKKGEEIWLGQSVQLVMEKKKIVGFQAIGRNITQQKQAEEALRKSERNLSITLNSIGDAVIVTNNEGRVIRMNPVSESMTGWTIQQALNKPINEVCVIIDSIGGRPMPNPVDQALKTGRVTGLQTRAKLISKSGRHFHITDSAAPIRKENREVIGVVMVFRDVTESQKLEQAKSNFINAISHELRTPLTPILGYASMMLDNELSREQQEIFLKEIIHAIDREQRLVDELLTVARLKSDLEKYQFREVNAYRLFFGMETNNAMLVRQLITDRYIGVNFDYHYNVSTELKSVIIKVDPERIQQVVENLLTNAVKYSPKSRISIQVTAKIDDLDRLQRSEKKNDSKQPEERDNQWVAVTVCDRGRGIPLEEQEKIFNPFYQVRKSMDDISDGIGHGLAISKRYIDAHHGVIEVESEPDKGSCFLVALPIERRVRKKESIKSVLLIENDQMTGALISFLLEQKKYQVTVAKDGRTGLRFLQMLSPNLVILDLQLFDLEPMIRLISEEDATIPVILCSALPEERLKEFAQENHNVKGYVTKPFNIETLIGEIER